MRERFHTPAAQLDTWPTSSVLAVINEARGSTGWRITAWHAGWDQPLDTWKLYTLAAQLRSANAYVENARAALRYPWPFENAKDTLARRAKAHQDQTMTATEKAKYKAMLARVAPTRPA